MLESKCTSCARPFTRRQQKMALRKRCRAYAATATLFSAIAGGGGWMVGGFQAVRSPSGDQEHASLIFPRTRNLDTGSSKCWELDGQYENDCYHGDPLDLLEYPLTEEMFQRSASPYHSTDTSLHRAFYRAREHGRLKVVVIGGSVTYGHGCRTPSGARDLSCAWPFRLQEWFDVMIDDFEVEVVNAAKPANDILDFLHNDMFDVLPEDSDADLIIVDFGVNDAIIEHFDYDVNNVKSAHELFIRYVQNEMGNSPALLYAESFICPRQVRSKPYQALNMAEVHGDVAQKHDVPMASFRHAVWPNTSETSTAETIWGSEVHPDWQVQQLLADVVVYYLEKSYARFCEVYGSAEEPSIQEVTLEAFKQNAGCLADTRTFKVNYAEYTADIPPPELVLSETVGWAFTNDIRGDKAIIGFGNSTKAVASFDLPCSGKRGILDIGYVVSYNGFGAVKVVIQGSQEALDTDKRDDDHSTAEAASNMDFEIVKGGFPDGAQRIENDGLTSVAVIDGLWGTFASIVTYQPMVIPEEIRDENIRVTFEILSEEGEIKHESEMNPSGKDRNREDRKFKLVSIQCC